MPVPTPPKTAMNDKDPKKPNGPNCDLRAAVEEILREKEEEWKKGHRFVSFEDAAIILSVSETYIRETLAKVLNVYDVGVHRAMLRLDLYELVEWVQKREINNNHKKE